MNPDLYQRVASLYKDFKPEEIAEAHRQLRRELNLNQDLAEKKQQVARLLKEIKKS